jgi:hypothetical protein
MLFEVLVIFIINFSLNITLLLILYYLTTICQDSAIVVTNIYNLLYKTWEINEDYKTCKNCKTCKNYKNINKERKER